MSGEPCTLGGFYERFEIDWDTGCWLWTGKFYPPRPGHPSDVTDGTHGKFDGTMAHRFGYLRLVGPVPEGMHLDHLCRVRACVNPTHLEPVTPQENNRRSPTCVPTAHAAQTHCVNGHPFDEKNTRISGGKRPGRRVCRVCSAEANRELRRRKKVSV